VTRAREASSTAEAACVTAVLAAETSAQEVVAVRDSVVLLVNDVEDQATLAEREAQERVSRVEAESTVVLASAHEETEGLVRKIALLESELAEARQT
jgi:hypothetical protein